MIYKFLFFILIAKIFAKPVEIEVNTTNSHLSIQIESMTGLKVELDIGNLFLEEIDVSAGVFDRIRLNDFHLSYIIGSPELPEVHRLIEIPQRADARIEIENIDFEYYKLSEFGIINPIFPTQPSLSKSQNPADVPFEWNQDIYDKNSFN